MADSMRFRRAKSQDVVTLTDPRLLNGGECLRWLWLDCHAPLPKEAAALAPSTYDEIRRLARGLYPGGVAIDEPPWRQVQAVKRTLALMQDRKVPAIFDAAFEADGASVRVDILERLSRGKWGLRKISASKGKVESQFDGLCFQRHVLRASGVDVRSIAVIHLDEDFVRDGVAIDPTRLFKRVDVTADIAAHRPTIGDEIAQMRKTMARKSPPPPKLTLACRRLGPCAFFDVCHPNAPADWIGWLPRMQDRLFEQLTELGVTAISDIPDDIGLNSTQLIVRDVMRSGVPFQSSRLAAALKDAGLPAHYLDFETMSPAVPLYDGTSPYDIIPFQWSLHRAGRTGKLDHFAFLADGRTDPRRDFAESLIDALAGGDTPILVYSSFERQVIDKLLVTMPRKLARHLDGIKSRLFDLLNVVRGHVYHPAFDYSYSIKTVGPALAPHVTYDGLQHVANGAAASAAFERIASGAATADEEATLRRELLHYCKIDTLAMVEVHKALRRLAKR